jgi:hypothetical protein
VNRLLGLASIGVELPQLQMMETLDSIRICILESGGADSIANKSGLVVEAVQAILKKSSLRLVVNNNAGQPETTLANDSAVKAEVISCDRFSSALLNFVESDILNCNLSG